MKNDRKTKDQNIDKAKRKHVEEALKARLELVKLTAKISRVFVSVPLSHIDDEIDLALKKMAQAGAANRGSLFIVSDDLTTITNTNEWCASSSDSQIKRLQDIPFKTFGYHEKQLRNSETIKISSIDDYPSEASSEIEWVKKYGFRSMLFVPILQNKKLYGTIGFYGKIGKKIEWPDFYIEFLRIIGDVFISVIERKQAEETMENLSQQNKMILNAAGEGICGLDLEGKTTFANPAAVKMIGWEIEDILGKNQHNLLHHTKPDGSSYDKNKCPIYAAFKDGKIHHVDDEVFWRKDGTSFPVEYISTPTRDEQGNLTGAVVTFSDITERQRVEAALRLTQFSVDKFPDAVYWMGPDAKFIYVNDAAVEALGYSREELLTMTVHDIGTELPAEVWPAHWEGLKEKGSIIITTMHQRKDKTIFPVEISLNLIQFGDKEINCATAKDITERMLAEEKLREYSLNLEKMVTERTEDLQTALQDTEKAKDKIDAILKSVADGLIVTDTRHRILLMNHAAEDFLGVRLSNVIGRSIDFAIEEKSLRSKIKYTLNKKTTGYQFDFSWPGKDLKHPRILRARTSVIHDKEGKDFGIVTTIHDVSKEREVDQMKTDFLTTAAHELRTPLTSIQGFSELLITRNDISEDEKSRFLRSINNQSVALAKIITDLLDVTRIESRNGMALNKVHKDIKETIKKIIPYFEGETQIHTFKLNLPKKPVKLHFDEDKTEQILKNIIGNSVKYSPKGGEIEIVVVPKEKDCMVSVSDQGIGMTSKQVEKIFSKFYRVDTSDSAPPGTGLGMVIVKHLVESHKGKIWVNSKLGEGTTVSFTLPLR